MIYTKISVLLRMGAHIPETNNRLKVQLIRVTDAGRHITQTMIGLREDTIDIWDGDAA